VVDPVVGATVVEERLRRTLPEHVGVQRAAERKAELARAAAAFQLMLDVVSAMGLVLAALITSNRLATVYHARRWEIGVMRALGARPWSLVRTLLVEAGIVAGLGVLAGIPLGLAFAQTIVRPVAETMTLSLQQIVAPTWVAPRAAPILAAALAGVASGVVAALVPARRAATMPVLEVLATGPPRDTAAPAAVGRGLRLVVAGLALALLVLQLLVDVGPLAGATMVLVAAAGGLAVAPGLRVASQLLGGLLRRTVGIGLEERDAGRGRAVGAGAVLMAGVALAIWVGSMRDSFEAYVVERIMLDRQSDLVVDSGFNDVAVGGDDARLPGALLDELATVPGVAAVGAGVNAAVLAPETGIVAADPIRFRDRAFGVWPLETGALPDAMDRVAAGEAVLADENLVARRGLAVGDPVRLATPGGLLVRPLAGVTPTKFRSPGGDVMLSRDLYRAHWHDDSVSQAFVVLEPAASADAVKRAILDGFGERHHLRVLTRAELAEWYADGVRQAYGFLNVLVVLTLVVVAIGASDALAASVLERTREIGTLRALGASARDVGAQIVAQALAIALVGSTLAIAVGYAMSFAFVGGLIPSVLGWRLGLRVSSSVAATAIALGAVACLAGAALPARRAARMSPARALRYE
jgi:putative ABC transport system permease protein